MPTVNPIAAIALSDTSILPLCDRRANHRMQTVFRVARVITTGDEGLARIRNLSDYGAGLTLSLPTNHSDALTLELADRVELRGNVVWVQGDRLGLQFDQPINCRELLTNLAYSARCAGARPVRLPLAATALTRSERGLRCAKVIDISLRGLKLVHDGSLKEGLFLQISLPSGINRQGIVRWSRDERAGVMLLEPLSVEALGSMRRLMHMPEPIMCLQQETQNLQP